MSNKQELCLKTLIKTTILTKFKTLLKLTSLLLLPNLLFSQTILRGHVRDTLGSPIPFANVLTLQNDSAVVVAFGIADGAGYYTFETPSTPRFIVKASALGYESKTVSLDNTENAKMDLDFSLAPKEFILKETVISANGKIIAKSDTTTFRADAFRDSTERNLEELLAKLPGVDVDKNTGVISVQGKPIKKILIDGDDLTGRNYQLMSQNMSADVVDKIQVIDRFTENKLLKGLKRSDDKVINITLKENRKKLLFGNAVLGYGNDERTNNSLNLFGFYKKLKTISFVNFNTVGTISTADRMVGSEFGEESEADNQHSLLNSRNSAIIDIGRTPSVSLNSQSVRFNRAALASTFWTMRPTDEVSMKASFTFSNDRLQSFVNNEYRYLLRDTTFLLSETNVIERKPTIVEGHFELQADVSPKSLLRYRGDVRKSFSNNTTQTIANQNNVYNQLNANVLAHSHTLDFTNRLTETQALTINAVFVADNNQQTYQLSQTLPRSTPSVKMPSDALLQSVERPMTYFALNGQWLYSKNTFKISSYSGVVYRNENLTSQLSASLKDVPLLVSDTFSNDLTVRQQNYYVGLNVKTDWKSVEWFSDVSGGFYQTNWRENLNQKGFYALPTIGFKTKIKEKHNLFGTYAFNFNLPQSVDLMNGFVLNDYRNLTRGSAVFIPANSHTGIVNYNYGEFSDNFIGRLSVIYTANNKGYRSNLGIDADFNTSNKVENTFTNQTAILSASVEQYLPTLYVRLKIRPSVSLGNYPNTLNGSDIRETKTANSSVDVSLRSAFLKWFNFHVGATLSQSNVNTTLNDVTNSVKNQSIGSFVDFYLRINKRLNGKIENEVFYVQQANNLPQKYYFINASASYDIIQTRLSAHLTFRNALNTQEFVNVFATDFSTQLNQIRLLPRYILLEINFRF